jgi:general secretion pathway protein G
MSWRARAAVLGFTLVEVLIALAIVAALAAIAIPTYVGYIERSRSKQSVIDLRGLEFSLDKYRVDFGALPDDLDQVANPVPLDPWGQPYEYLNLQNGAPGINGQRRRDRNMNPVNSDYDLYSCGPDGETQAQFTAVKGRDDIVRAADGAYLGAAKDF